jgi:hypothetical protein
MHYAGEHWIRWPEAGSLDIIDGISVDDEEEESWRKERQALRRFGLSSP